jgi:hypothetical protein
MSDEFANEVATNGIGTSETIPTKGGIPKTYLQICSRRFLTDLESGTLRVPEVGATLTAV